MTVWINGEFVPPERAVVPILSQSFGRGCAVFEVANVSAGPHGPAVFRLDAHIERFFSSAAALGMELTFSRRQLRDGVCQTVARGGIRSGAVKFFGYFGRVDFALVPRDRTADVAIFCVDMPTATGHADMSDLPPITLAVSSVRKLSPATVDVHAKATGNYVNAYLARSEAIARGCDDAILLDADGRVAEASLANIFFVRGGAVRTPRLTSALAGVTRDTVGRIIADLGLPLEEADISPDQAREADEAFITGSLARIRPVRAIDGREFAPCPGPVTQSIRGVLNDAYDGRSERYRDWLTSATAEMTNSEFRIPNPE